MNEWHPFAPCIQLHVAGRISETDARRQERAAREILRRLAQQPGVVLADDVGTGKTFVALAAGTSVALSDPQRRPVVVMVPPGLKEKWPQDFAVFSARCLPPEMAERVQTASAGSAVELLKLLDDPEDKRKSIIFLTHGAMHRGLTDGWVKLAMIQRALYRRHHTGPLRQTLSRAAGKLLQLGWAERRGKDIWDRLLDAPTGRWLKILQSYGIDPEGDRNADTDDDPVPALCRKYSGISTRPISTNCCRNIPQRRSDTYEQRIVDARRLLTAKLQDVWRRCLKHLDFKLPLLVMDEAHHLKNPGTRLSSLFQNPDAEGDAEELARGELGGIFERMLFLTATPFQLGHHELCSVLERFEGIAWDVPAAPSCGREVFKRQIADLRKRLDAAQAAAFNLDSAWGRLRSEDVIADGRSYGFHEIEAWWAALQSGAKARLPLSKSLKHHQETYDRMRVAEAALQPWVIRHLKDRTFNGRPRRERLPGAAIINDSDDASETGIEISGDALLPFLLAARATACTPESRPVFAGGIGVKLRGIPTHAGGQRPRDRWRR